MTPRVCPFEDQVLAAVTSGDWPARADESLRNHVTECATCADLAMVGGLLKVDHAAALAESNVPSSGQVWWRAQVRARAEAQRAAARPIFIAQAVAGAALVGLIAAVSRGCGRRCLPPAACCTRPACRRNWAPWRGSPSARGSILAPVALYFVFARE